MSNEQQFVDGLRVYAPREGAPDFVICNLVINVADLTKWLSGRSGDVRVDVKRSRNEKLYASVNDWKPKEGNQERLPRPQPEQTGGGFEDDPDDRIPF